MVLAAQWTIEELSSVIHMPAHGLRRKIAFWQSHGLLKEETTDTFILVEEHKGHAHDAMVLEEEEAESAMASAKDQKEEELQVLNPHTLKNNNIVQKFSWAVLIQLGCTHSVGLYSFSWAVLIQLGCTHSATLLTNMKNLTVYDRNKVLSV